MLTLAGSATEAKTLFVASTSWKILLSASAMAVAFDVTAKYLPLPCSAMLFSSAVWPGPWPVVPGLTSTVYV